ncbi:winged helix-turn-helix transcriptional regulator [Anaerococcus sp. AGMB00486]|uniref:Winged helix-turn-helix transcriptional regulator n=2 Tax=Anaerococcus TaxID=165779 RepID=A0ABX2N7U8_9FIRM|nr:MULTISPECIES: autorepressor SdpR family transcription factor [Anaerococcus]MDY3006844.1 autorepressor SdpR family transcription factor [Anaerococcus porci]MSS77119.1 winged helix-turn-helix transcriptional regulator [Anaerococcus porci]NVF10758.1 winged helix-turn-helix transcriptional regulator [Anaerococcus faecalis]
MAFADTFKVLSDPERRKILELLKKGAMSAGEIASNFNTTGATISYHLKILKNADLIFERKEKNYIYYQLNISVLEDVMIWIASLKEGDTNANEE